MLKIHSSFQRLRLARAIARDPVLEQLLTQADDNKRKKFLAIILMQLVEMHPELSGRFEGILKAMEQTVGIELIDILTKALNSQSPDHLSEFTQRLKEHSIVDRQVLGNQLLETLSKALNTQFAAQKTSKCAEIWPWLKQAFSIKTIIDIGANNGDYAEFLSHYFDVKQTYVFEPLPSCIKDLEDKQNRIQNFTFFNVALSDQTSQQSFFQNDYGPASSLLEISEDSKAEFPQTAQAQKITINVARLDDLLCADDLESDILIKIDVQGLEDKVIRGGWETFARATCVVIEMSFVPMYTKQLLFGEVHQMLTDLGYYFAGVKNQICSVSSGRPLFAHCLYIRQETIDFPNAWD